MFKLLEHANEQTPHDAQFIKIFGKKWVVREYAKPSDAPPYTCISYAWGEERTDNILNDRQLMSSRTIPAIESAIIASNSQENWATNIQFSLKKDPLKEKTKQLAALNAAQALWIDALCVPFVEPARTGSLQSMGEIFSVAYQVIVVLTEQCSNAIYDICQGKKLDSSAILALETEGWANRAWTYQEAVNSSYLYFIVSDEMNAIVSGNDFLRAIVDGIAEYKLLHEFDKISWLKAYPGLDNLEILLADYMISDYQDRSAYQVMSVMERRTSEQPEDHFYAMVGSITTTSSKVEEETLHPSEYFLRVCERKGDYSFIYNTGLRSQTPGQRWRPVEGKYTAVLPGLLTFGSRQEGTNETTHLKLDKMHRLSSGAINADGVKATRWFVEPKGEDLSPDGIADEILKRLKALGFTGCGEYLEFETGFFFPQSKIVHSDDLITVVSCDINWVNGGPGLLLRPNSNGIYDLSDVGAYVGRHPKSGETIKVG